MIEKSRGLGADQVILDLEDAVAPEQKVLARTTAIAELARGGWDGRIVSVRVNASPTEWGGADLESLEGAGAAIDTVIVPKVESASDVTELGERLSGWPGSPRLEVLIETAAGLDDVRALARASGAVETLILGPLDLAASLGIDALGAGPAGDDLGGLGAAIRYHVLVAARAAGIAAIDGPFTAIDDPAGLERSAATAAGAGFDGKWVVHPAQIEVVNEVFTPSPAALERARATIEAMDDAALRGIGAVRAEGVMLDEASRRVAEQILTRASAGGVGTQGGLNPDHERTEEER
jgi:citrate lyase subunit beta/citryl-CoA lyase